MSKLELTGEQYGKFIELANCELTRQLNAIEKRKQFLENKKFTYAQLVKLVGQDEQAYAVVVGHSDALSNNALRAQNKYAVIRGTKCCNYEYYDESELVKVLESENFPHKFLSFNEVIYLNRKYISIRCLTHRGDGK